MWLWLMKIPTQYGLILPIGQSKAMCQCKCLFLELMYGGQNWNQNKWRHQVVKFVTNASGATWWCKKYQLLAKQCAILRPNLQPVQEASDATFKLISVRKIQSMPWVRYASGNCFFVNWSTWENVGEKTGFDARDDNSSGWRCLDHCDLDHLEINVKIL